MSESIQTSSTNDATQSATFGNKVICVGRNYVDHAKELNNPVPKSPLFFIKPCSSLVDITEPLTIPTGLGQVDYELEVAVKLGVNAGDKSVSVLEWVEGVTLALDLTLRDVQSELKKKGHPWERAKAFKGSAPIGEFIPLKNMQGDWKALSFELFIDQVQRQLGRMEEMIFPLDVLLEEAHEAFGLEAGDIVLTGTPAGVGPLKHAQSLRGEMRVNNELVYRFATEVV